MFLLLKYQFFLDFFGQKSKKKKVVTFIWNHPYVNVIDSAQGNKKTNVASIWVSETAMNQHITH